MVVCTISVGKFIFPRALMFNANLSFQPPAQRALWAGFEVLGGGGLGTQLCLTLCNAMDCSPPGLSVHGISQARILEYLAISFCMGTS